MVDYPKLSAVLIEALKQIRHEQTREIQNLRQENDELRRRSGCHRTTFEFQIKIFVSIRTGTVRRELGF